MEIEQPGSVVTLKNVAEKDKQIWIDLTPEQIARQLKAGGPWLEARRFIGGRYFGFIVRVDDIVLVELYR